MEDIVFRGANDQAVTSSLLIAEKFGKGHKHVLDAIRELIKGFAENSADPMFEETTYINEQNKQAYPMFLMNRDGFTLLAMGFTYKEKKSQSNLDITEKHGFLGKMFDIVSKMVKNVNNRND